MRLYGFIIERYTRRATVGPFTRLARAHVLNPTRRRKAEFIAREESKSHARSLVILRRQHDRRIMSFLVNGRPVDPAAISIELPEIIDNVFPVGGSIPRRAAAGQ